MAYARGDVVLVPFPFTDQSSMVIRPTVVVSSNSYRERTGDLIVAMITSQRHELPTDVRLRDWESANLLHPSWVRSKLATLSEKLVRFSPGRLGDGDLRRVAAALRAALDL